MDVENPDAEVPGIVAGIGELGRDEGPVDLDPQLGSSLPGRVGRGDAGIRTRVGVLASAAKVASFTSPQNTATC